MEMQKLKPYHMENLYTALSKTPCGSYIEGKKQELTEKQKQRFLSGTTIHEVHRLLGTAFQYAVEWGILIKSPVPVDSPKKSTQERSIWTEIIGILPRAAPVFLKKVWIYSKIFLSLL